MFPYRYRIETIADTWNEAFAAYDPTPYPGDAMLFRASTGFVLGNDVGRLNGWERLIVGNVEVNECPGDHSTMCEQPHVRVLARRLGSYLRRQVSDNKFREPDVTTSNERKQSPLLVEADRAREGSTNPALTIRRAILRSDCELHRQEPLCFGEANGASSARHPESA